MKYLSGTKKLNIWRFHTEVRKTIYDYYQIQYEIEPFAEENGNKYFSCDESEFYHDFNNDFLWVLGMINNTTKDFRVVVTKSRDLIHLKEFISIDIYLLEIE